jgi:hypothetical protein
MNTGNKKFSAFLIISFILLIFTSSGCDQNRPPMSDGLDDLKTIAQQYFSKLENGKVQRIKGFFIECAVDFMRVKGIRISETVCDKDSSRNIIIRVTDPTSRPPSQLLDKIQLISQTDNTITVYRGKTVTTSNDITIEFHRSGQSIIFNTQIGENHNNY